MTRSDPLVSATDLKAMLAMPDVRVIDATWIPGFVERDETGRDLYSAGHIPGAVFFDIDDICDTDSPLPHMLPDPVKFSSRVRKMGLGDGNRLVIYDQNGFFAAARVWWMFRAMGAEDVVVLDGGYKAWLENGGDIEDLPPVAVERHFTPRVRADLIKDMDQVAGTEALVLDARPDGRFCGTTPEPRKGVRGGHIPGSQSLPASELLENGHLKSAAQLAKLFKDKGIDAAKPIITSCGSGVSAAIISLALARLGNWEAALYDGSWAEWGASEHPVSLESA